MHRQRMFVVEFERMHICIAIVHLILLIGVAKYKVTEILASRRSAIGHYLLAPMQISLSVLLIKYCS